MSNGYVGPVFDWLRIFFEGRLLLVRATTEDPRYDVANFDDKIVEDATAIVTNIGLFNGLMKKPNAVYLEPSRPPFDYSEIQISKAGLEAYIEQLKALQD